MASIHVIGAGMAGLAAAVGIAKAGGKVIVHEAAGHAGGRCRSFFDNTIGRLIDNGNHLLLGANRAVFDYLDDVGAAGGLTALARAVFPFVDVATGERWSLRPNGGRLPWWIFSKARRVPDSRWSDYLGALRLAWATPEATVADCLGGPDGPLYERLWKPLTSAVLNTDPGEAAARLLWPVVYETFGKGEAACRGYVCRDGLSPNLVDPGVAFVTAKGGEFCFGQRLRAVETAERRARSLDLTSHRVELGLGDCVILALPPAAVESLLPEVPAPRGSRAIVNAHYRLDRAIAFPEGSRFLGLVGGTAQWLFSRGEVVSVTVSAADALAEEANETLARLLWADVARALDLAPSPQPPCRIVKEKRATFAQTPASLRLRPGPRVGLENLFLAGDWTDTGLPATIESAVRSGRRAAAFALGTL